MASGPEGTDPLNSKKWVLKVSIHCGGCERKIRRILHKIKGVYDIEIDANQNRVTVTGNIDGESLVQKLLKYGKHAELLTEKSPTAAATTAAAAAKIESNGKEKAVPAAPAPETEEKKKAEKGKEVIQSPEIPPETTTVSDEVSASKPDSVSKSQPEKISSGDTESKKKEREVKGEENRVNEREISGTVSSAGVNSPQFPANIPPLYATASYHTAHPSTSHAYYAAPPPEISSNYAYYDNSPAAYSPPPAGYSPPYFYSSESYYGSMEQPSTSTESYDMFNDENPNACELM